MPDGVEDRNADIWEALLAVADAAGGLWPELARVAAVALVADSKAAVPSLGVRLLMDLRDVFSNQEAMFSEDIVNALVKIEDAPWGDLHGKELTHRQLAQRLSNYSIKPRDVRLGLLHKKGYRREDLHDAWTRYCPVTDVANQNNETQTINTAEEIREKQSEAGAGPAAYESVTSVTSGTDPEPFDFEAALSPAPDANPCDYCGYELNAFQIADGVTIHPDCAKVAELDGGTS